MKRRFLCVLLALSMALTLLPPAALAVKTGEEETASAEIVYATHPGIGSIEDILPLPNTYRLIPGAEYDVRGSYYSQLDMSSTVVQDSIYGSDLFYGPSKKEIMIDLSAIEDETLLSERTFSNVSVTVTKTDNRYSAEYEGDIASYAENAVSAALGALLYEDPEWSWLVNTEFNYGYSTDFTFSEDDFADTNTKTYTGLTVAVTEIRYGMSETGYRDATTAPSGTVTADNKNQANTRDRTAFEERLDSIMAEIGDLRNASAYAKVKALYDWVCNNMEYAHYEERQDQDGTV